MSDVKRNILILAAHPRIYRSQVIAAMLAHARTIDGVSAIDLYAEYPDFDIDVEAEQDRLAEHDVIIFLFPFFWYSMPSLLREWQDLVLEYGFAFGIGTLALKGKTFLAAISAADSHAAFHASGSNRHTLREFLYPLEQMADRCAMDYLPPFALFDSATVAEDHQLDPFLEDWDDLLRALAADKLDIDAASELVTLNDGLHSVLGEI